jgi:hypothetical protein
MRILITSHSRGTFEICVYLILEFKKAQALRVSWGLETAV